MAGLKPASTEPQGPSMTRLVLVANFLETVEKIVK